MATRRQFLEYGVVLSVASASGLAFANADFEQYLKEQESGAQFLQKEWDAYRANYLAAYQNYRAEIANVWSSVETSDQTTWIEYSADFKVRRVVDFENNEIRLSFTQEQAKQVDDKKIEQELSKVADTTVEQAFEQDPVLSSTLGQSITNKQKVTGVNKQQVTGQLANAERVTEQTSKGEVVTVVVPMPSSAVPDRAKAYLPLIQEQTTRWNLPPSLVVSIMHAESAFNPMARSHIPAFGLMQIVPASAGRDATKHAWGRERLLTGTELYQPSTNIELGCAYLNLLDTRYLAAVKNPQSRQYCVISAYNTGAGNVARAFTGKTSVAGAAPKINSMTAQQVYNHLYRHLPYQETRDYLARVSTRMNNLGG